MLNENLNLNEKNLLHGRVTVTISKFSPQILERTLMCNVHSSPGSTAFAIITHLAGQMYVWHGCKWNFAGPQIYLQPAKIKSQHFGVSLKFLVCN